MRKKLPINWILIGACILFLALYIATLWPGFGILSIAAFLTFIALDFFTSQQSAKPVIIELVIAIGAAVVAWLALSAALQTPSPLDVVTSCSMLPVLQRGDLVIVQGATQFNAPVVEYSEVLPNTNVQRSNCTIAKRRTGPTISQCTSSISVVNPTSTSTVNVSRSAVQGNDIIVFESPQAGLVIHRAILVLRNKDTGKLIYVTKGDNNQVVDQEAGLNYVQSQHIHGRYIFRIPYVGYLRLFLAGQFAEPRGCDTLVDLN